MKYGDIIEGKFLKRINRFIAEVEINETIEKVHVKNTGRLKELFVQGATCILEIGNNPNRKTKYSLIAIEKNGRWVNIDSQAPNKVGFEAIQLNKIKEIPNATYVKQEVPFGQSRFDLFFESKEQKGFIEVKGVTLEENGVASFPDAPTTRGTKHIYELIKAVETGYVGIILFIIQLEGCTVFKPNRKTDPDFCDALLEAHKRGVKIVAYDTLVRENEMILHQPIPVQLI